MIRCSALGTPRAARVGGGEHDRPAVFQSIVLRSAFIPLPGIHGAALGPQAVASGGMMR